VGGNPHSFTYHLILFVCFVFVFQERCLPFKFGGEFFFDTPDLHRPFDIVFLDTLRTMCHFSLGVGKTFMAIIFVVIFIAFV
jgi:hypothetical protein